mgnify:CR=1 FL=1
MQRVVVRGKLDGGKARGFRDVSGVLDPALHGVVFCGVVGVGVRSGLEV